MSSGVSKLIREWIPLIATFLECTPSHRKEALKEVLLILALSLIPIWGGAILTTALSDSKDGVGILGASLELIKNGELILYSTSIIAPIFFLVINEPVGERPYPDRYIQGTLITIILIICLLMFSVQRINPSSGVVFKWSVYIFLISVFLLYLATVFRNWMNDGPDLKKTERDFSNAFDAWRDR